MRLGPFTKAERLGLAAAVAAGLSWAFTGMLEYPPGYFLAFRDDFWLGLVVFANLLRLWLTGGCVAALFSLPVLLARRLIADEPEAETRPRAWPVALLLLGLAALPRLVLLQELPGVPWTDGVHAIYDGAAAGRFLWPWEAVRLMPLEAGSTGRIMLFGLYVDYVRALLHVFPDRATAYAMLGALPGICLPAALYLLTRRLATEAAARLAGLLLAFLFPALAAARWGWDQQLMLLLQVLSLERLTAGLDTGRRLPMAAAGLLAGLSLHTYVASFPATAGALAVLAFRAAGLRANASAPHPRGRALSWYLAGLVPMAALLALVYVSWPEALGGRGLDLMTASKTARPPGYLAVKLVRGILYNTGILSFSIDPNPRHALTDSPPLPLVLAALLPLGLSRLRGAAAVLGTLLGTLAAGTYVVMTMAPGQVELAPNTYQTGLAIVLAVPAAAAGLACLGAVRLRAFPGLRPLLPYLAALLIATGELSRFVRWGLPTGRAPMFGYHLMAAGKFLDVAGPGRACVDRWLFSNEDSRLLVGFWVHRERALSRFDLRCVRAFRQETDVGDTRLDWFLTGAPPDDWKGVRLGTPGTLEGRVYAVNLARLRRVRGAATGP